MGTTSLKRKTAAVKVAEMGRPPNEPDLSTYSKRVGNRVRVLRGKKGWTSDELWLKLREAGLELSSGTIRSWESGRRPVNPDHYPTLAKVFGVKVREFLPAD